MTEKLKKPFSKNMHAFSRTGEDEFVIEAQAPIDGSSREFRQVAFKSSMIEMLFEIDACISGMVLKNGVSIPVALPFRTLKERIYNNDADTGNSLDLSLVTGKAVVKAQEVKLSTRFNPVAVEDETGEGGLSITLFVHHKGADREFKRVTICEKDIDFYEPHGQRAQTEIFIKMKSGRTANGWSDFYAAIPLTSFTYYVNAAHDDEETELNLLDNTRPKDARTFKMS